MILVAGAGFLGSSILKKLNLKQSQNIIATAKTLDDKPGFESVKFLSCDLTKEADLNRLVSELGGEDLTVFYCAACHNIDFVYENPNKAREVNIIALENFLKTVPNISKLLFTSTDCVYGENDFEHPKFKESDFLNPINEYGRQKKEAEETVNAHGFTCVRLPYMLGPSVLKKEHFYDVILKKLAKNETIEMIDGLCRSVLSYESVADILIKLSLIPKNELPKTVNICGDRGYSKYEMAVKLAQNHGFSEKNIIKISEEIGKKFFKDKRASSAVMDNSLLKSLLGVSEINWSEDKCCL